MIVLTIVLAVGIVAVVVSAVAAIYVWTHQDGPPVLRVLRGGKS